jgi:hypothetical protein
MEGILPYVHKALTRRYGYGGNPPYQNLSSAASSETLDMESHYSKIKGRKDVESNSDNVSSDLPGFNHCLPPNPFVHERRMSCTAVEDYKDSVSLNVKLSHRRAISCSFGPADQEAVKKKVVESSTIKDI